MTHARIEDLLADMDAAQARLASAGDARRFFHATYTRTTRAVAEEIARVASRTTRGCNAGI